MKFKKISNWLRLKTYIKTGHKVYPNMIQEVDTIQYEDIFIHVGKESSTSYVLSWSYSMPDHIEARDILKVEKGK